jgi:acyl-CoA thioesterase I
VNPVLLYFISGESLYSGGALLLMVLALSLFAVPKSARPRNLAAWLALIMIAMAAPPLPWELIAVFFVAFTMWYACCNSSAPHRILRIGSTLSLGVLIVCGIALEYPYRGLPYITGPADNHLVVIGDSISAGLNPQVAPWPYVMQQETRIPVRNLSRVGATTADGIAMAAYVTPDDRVVLVELGGNDLIAGLPADRFEKSLDSILSRLASNQRTVAMMELPLLPYRIAYGRAQRRLASKYGVWLIPKRYFVQVISGSSATSDGLHLSDEGAHRMATLVARVLSPVLRNP